MECPNCKNVINANSKFCSKCGKNLVEQRERKKFLKVLLIYFLVVGIVSIGVFFYLSNYVLLTDTEKYMLDTYDVQCNQLKKSDDKLLKKYYILKCNGFDERVYIYKKTNDEFYDNYVAVKYDKQMREFLNNKVNTYFSKEINLHYSMNKESVSQDVSADASFDDYVKESNAKVSFILEIKESSYSSDEQIKKLADELNNVGLSYHFRVIVINDKEFGKYDSTELSSKASFLEFDKSAIVSNENDEVNIRWLVS